MVVIAVIAQAIERNVFLLPVGQQPHLVEVALAFEIGNRLEARHFLALEGGVFGHPIAHPLLQIGQFFVAERRTVADLAEIAARGDRMVNGQVVAREQVIERRAQQEGQRTAVDARPVCIGHRDRGEAAVLLDGIGQLAQFVVDDGGYQRGFTGPPACLEQLCRAGPARGGQYVPVRQVDFHRVVGSEGLYGRFVIH